MYIKLKGICIDLKKERDVKKLSSLINICKEELLISSTSKQEFIKIVISIVSKRVTHLTIDNKITVSKP